MRPYEFLATAPSPGSSSLGRVIFIVVSIIVVLTVVGTLIKRGLRR